MNSSVTDTDGAKKRGNQPFLVEESSRVTVQHIRELLRRGPEADYHWCCIALIAHISAEADLVGRWAEGCPEWCRCNEATLDMQGRRLRGQKGKRRSIFQPQEDNDLASRCAFRCCRAPELAAGAAMHMQEEAMHADRPSFSPYVAKAPPNKRSELQGSFVHACGRMWGSLTWTLSDLC